MIDPLQHGAMEMRAFGNTGIRVSALGLGCARIGGIFQQGPDAFLDLLGAAVEAGINFFDTADMYSQGESERLLGRTLSLPRTRDRVVIATKAGYVLPTRRRALARMKPLLRPFIRILGLNREHLAAAIRGVPTQSFSPRYLRRAVEGSLRRLRTDRIDLFQLHSPPSDVIERGEWVPVLEGLKREGKILHFGVACDTAADALLALRQPISAVQVTVNLLERSALELLLPRSRERGVAVIARECLANGLLAKDAADIDLKSYCSSQSDLERRTRQLAAARQLAIQSQRSLPEIALRFVRGLPGVSVALVGARTRPQLDALLRLRQEEPLSPELLNALPD